MKNERRAIGALLRTFLAPTAVPVARSIPQRHARMNPVVLLVIGWLVLGAILVAVSAHAASRDDAERKPVETTGIPVCDTFIRRVYKCAPLVDDSNRNSHLKQIESTVEIVRLRRQAGDSDAAISQQCERWAATTGALYDEIGCPRAVD